MSDGRILSGQQFDPRGDTTVLTYTEQVQDYDKNVSPQVVGVEGVDGVEITPMDAAAAKVRTWDLAAIQAQLATSVIKVAGKTTVDLPDVLTAIAATYNKDFGTGVGSHPTSKQGLEVVGAGSGSLHPTASAQASASIVVDISPSITTYRNLKVPCTHAFFYMALPVTTAQILTRLATAALFGAPVTDLPVFRPKIHSFVLKGGQLALRQSADTEISCSESSDVTSHTKAYQSGDEYSKEVGVSSKTVTIGPVINGTINISGGTSDTTGIVTISVDASCVGISGSINLSPITNTPAALSGTVSASVTPTSASATSPTGIPTTGLYLVDLTPDIGEYGYAFIHAEVVDFSVYA